MTTKQIDLGFELKEVTEEGVFTGLASTYDNVDLGDDVVRPGAFTKTLNETRSVPILLGHDKTKVIGEGVLSDSKDGLRIDGKLDIDIDPLAQQTHQKMKRGRIKGLSIGFSTVKDAIRNGVRELLELKVWEVSLTPFPMNQAAVITAVKESTLAPEPGSTQDTEPQQPEAQAVKTTAEPELLHSLLNFLKEN